MRANLTKADWDAYRTKELAILTPLLTTLGFTLEDEQPHIQGERYLMKRNKFVLVARDGTGARVVVKASNNKVGVAEIQKEKQVRDTLQKLSFANDQLLIPSEVYAGSVRGYFIFATEFILQDKPFVSQPLEEQFFLALRALEAQEGFHASTYGHEREIKKIFEVYSADTYLKKFSGYIADIRRTYDNADTASALSRAEELLKKSTVAIERYNHYLTHNDFVPHNIRLKNRALYMLDYAEFWFGNKYEGWARFINYMVLHNPPLAKALVEYVRTNRPAEYENLRLMRIYKLGVILAYHARTLAETEGDLHALSLRRMEFWTTVLEHVLADTEVPETTIRNYSENRNELRSDEEKKRLKDIGVL